MYRPMGHGFIEVIVGPMYSGKSEELIRRLKRSKIAKQEVIVFKPIIDDRYHKEDVVSHSGIRMRAITIENPEEMLDYVNGSTQVVGIDEINFFSYELVDVCVKLADRGIRVIAAGLDMDFRGVPFGAVPHLMARAEFVDKLQAVCLQCGAPATRTQRLIDKVPASYDDPIILVGADESYEARCRKCHQVLDKADHV